MKPLLLPCALLLASAARAGMMEIELPAELASCHSARWGSQQKYGLLPPSRGQQELRPPVLILEGFENLERHRNDLRACGGRAARELDLGLVSVEPREGTALFERLFQRCVSSELPKVRVRVVALRLTRHC